MAIKNPGRSSRAKATETRKKALELRTLGLSYRQIGEQLGVSKVCAYKHVLKAIESLENESRGDAKVNRRLDLERLDWIIRDAMKQSLKGDLQAMDRIMKAFDRRARIYGFNAPQKVAHTNPDGTEATPPTGVVLIPEPMSREDWLNTTAGMMTTAHDLLWSPQPGLQTADAEKHLDYAKRCSPSPSKP